MSSPGSGEEDFVEEGRGEASWEPHATIFALAVVVVTVVFVVLAASGVLGGDPVVYGILGLTLLSASTLVFLALALDILREQRRSLRLLRDSLAQASGSRAAIGRSEIREAVADALRPHTRELSLAAERMSEVLSRLEAGAGRIEAAVERVEAASRRVAMVGEEASRAREALLEAAGTLRRAVEEARVMAGEAARAREALEEAVEEARLQAPRTALAALMAAGLPLARHIVEALAGEGMGEEECRDASAGIAGRARALLEGEPDAYRIAMASLLWEALRALATLCPQASVEEARVSGLVREACRKVCGSTPGSPEEALALLARGSVGA